MTKRPVSPNWTLLFNDVSSLRLIVEACMTLECKVLFRVKKAPTGEYFLHVDEQDQSMTSYITARLLVPEVTHGADADFEFCLDVKHLHAALSSSSCNSSSVRFENYIEGGDRVVVKMWDQDMRSYEDSTTLTIFNRERADPLITMNYTLIIEMEVVKMKELIKKANKFHAETISLEVYTKTFESKVRSVVLLSVEGEHATSTQKFCHDVNTAPDGSIVVRAAHDVQGVEGMMYDIEDRTCMLKNKFSAEKLDGFLRAVPARMLMARAAMDTPLMLQCSIGGVDDGSQYVRFFIAPINDEDE